MSEIVIIGGGLTGLTAAYRLADTYQITLVEQDESLGGLIQSYPIEDYYIEKFYHHFFTSDTELIDLIEELGLTERVVWLTGTTGYYWEGTLYPMSTPFEVLSFPPLSLSDIFRLGLLVMRTKLIKDISSFDHITAKEWIHRMGGDGVYTNFFRPLLCSKFGRNADRVSAAWLLGRVRIRSNRGARGEKLGYVKGGFHHLVEALAGSIEKKGGRFITGNPARTILMDRKSVAGVKLMEGTIACDTVLSTVSPSTLSRLVANDVLDIDLSAIQYQGTCCLILGMNRALMNDGTYWLNINATVPFGALIEHTNFLPAKDYSGQHILYIAAYFQDPEDPLCRDSPEDVLERFLAGIESLFPDFNRDCILWWKLTRDARTAPVYETGYADKVLPYKTDIDGLYLAGMFSQANYPERSMNGSIKAGFRVADTMVRDLQQIVMVS